MTFDRTLAACRQPGVDREMFYDVEGERGPVKRARRDTAKRICSTCPVREACAAESFARREDWGVWGGFDEDQRFAVLRIRVAS